MKLENHVHYWVCITQQLNYIYDYTQIFFLKNHMIKKNHVTEVPQIKKMFVAILKNIAVIEVHSIVVV